jgi:hypothetical protein
LALKPLTAGKASTGRLGAGGGAGDGKSAAIAELKAIAAPKSPTSAAVFSKLDLNKSAPEVSSHQR